MGHANQLELEALKPAKPVLGRDRSSGHRGLMRLRRQPRRTGSPDALGREDRWWWAVLALLLLWPL